jgi:hypothetical protein
MGRFVHLLSGYGESDTEIAENFIDSINTAFQDGTEEDFKKLQEVLSGFMQLSSAINADLETQIQSGE